MSAAAGRPISWDFPPTPDQAGHVRDRVEGTLITCQLAALVDDAILLASEAFTNAVVHAGDETDLVRVTLTLGVDEIRLAVDDGSAKRPIPRPVADDEDETGRGLALIQALATTWGSDPRGDGKSVWFTLRHPAA